MKLRTFTAADMPSAMKMIREELGEDAVILASQPERGNKAIRVTAAVENLRVHTNFTDIRDTVDFAKKRSSQKEWHQHIGQILEYHRTPAELIELIKTTADSIDMDSLLSLQKLAAENSKSIIQAKALAMILQKRFVFSPLPLTEAGKKFLFIGRPGVGKTLTVARLATQLKMENIPVSVITIDYKRAGGVEQLGVFTDILELPLGTVSNPEELRDILRGTPLSHVTLIDSFSCNPYQPKELAMLNAYISSAVEPVLVMPAGLDSLEAADVARAFASPSLKRLMVTGMDHARRYGSLLAAADTGLAFSHVSASAKVIEQCRPLTSALLAEYILQYRLPNKH